ncbi:MAG: hypothetical protein II840_11675 [Kiritimatiellae bacterium]|nr:hypothetical protein [Kiritimatiellia bacterium]
MNDTITNLIADIRNWEKNAKKNSADPKLADICSALVPVLDSIATRLEQLVKDGFYVTPEAARKFAEAQKDIMDGKSLDAILMNPPLEGFAKFLSLPELGIQFRRYRSANMTKLIAAWRDDANDHVYEISVQRDGDSPNCGWRALATNDGHNVFQLRTKNRSNCEHFALSAMKRYLKCGHRKTYRTLAKKEGK